MPNLLDCPREVRDLCYSAYFETVLQDNAHTLLNGLPLLCSTRGVAIEATEAAIFITTTAITASRSELQALKTQLDRFASEAVSERVEAETEQKSRKSLDSTKEWGVLMEWGAMDSRIRGQEEVVDALKKRLVMLMEGVD